MEEFTLEKCGIEFDFSNIHKFEIPQIWALETMGRQDRKDEIMKDLIIKPLPYNQ